MNKENLINNLVQAGILNTTEIIDAFKKIDRVNFVLPEHKNEAYEDYPLSIGYNATISQPTTVAFMLEILEPRAGEKILDVGSGSGWTTALLSDLVGSGGNIYSTELINELVEFGRKNISKYGFDKTRIIQAEKTIGWRKQAPYDKILVSASAEILPEELVGQLKKGGRLVIPILNSVWQIDKDQAGKITKKEFPGFVFIPLR